MALELRGVETLYRGYSTLMMATLVAPDGAVIRREIEHHGDSIGVLPYDPERHTALLVRLPRAPVIWAGGPRELTEAPAGMIDDGDPEAAARREVLEEVGVELRELEPVGVVFVAPGVSSERMHLYLAPYSAADRVAEGGGAEGEQENITVVETPLAELWRRAEDGGLDDMKTLALVLALRTRRPELFG